MKLRLFSTSQDYIQQVSNALSGLNTRYQQVDLDSHSTKFQWIIWDNQCNQDIWVWSVIANRSDHTLLFLLQASGACLGEDDDTTPLIRHLNRYADTGEFALREPIRELTYIEGPLVAPNPITVLAKRFADIETILDLVRHMIWPALYPPASE